MRIGLGIVLSVGLLWGISQLYNLWDEQQYLSHVYLKKRLPEQRRQFDIWFPTLAARSPRWGIRDRNSHVKSLRGFTVWFEALNRETTILPRTNDRLPFYTLHVPATYFADDRLWRFDEGDLGSESRLARYVIDATARFESVTRYDCVDAKGMLDSSGLTAILMFRTKPKGPIEYLTVSTWVLEDQFESEVENTTRLKLDSASKASSQFVRIESFGPEHPQYQTVAKQYGIDLKQYG